jgi:hypothetical protein
MRGESIVRMDALADILYEFLAYDLEPALVCAQLVQVVRMESQQPREGRDRICGRRAEKTVLDGDVQFATLGILLRLLQRGEQPPQLIGRTRTIFVPFARE